MSNAFLQESPLDENVSKVIVKLIQEYGGEILNETPKFESLLKDYAPGKNRELFLIKLSLEESIPQEILHSNNYDSLTVDCKIKQQLTEKFLLQESALNWLINLWLTVKKELETHKNQLATCTNNDDEALTNTQLDELKAKIKHLESENKELKKTLESMRNETCGKNTIQNIEPPVEKVTICSDISNGNTVNYGHVAANNDWVFFRATNRNGNIYRITYDGSRYQQVNRVNSKCMVLINDWIYYSKSSLFGFGVYKIRIDGQGNQFIAKDDALFLVHSQGYLFYSNLSDDGYIYRIKTNGTERIKLNNDSSSFLNLVGDFLYYTRKGSDSDGTYQMKIDGSSKTKICNEKSYFLNVRDKWMFYSSEAAYGNLCKKSIDDREQKSILCSDMVSYVNVENGWIYYSNYSDHRCLYKIDIEGKNRQKLTNHPASYIHIAKEWIYYVNEQDFGNLYKISKDGIENRIVF